MCQGKGSAFLHGHLKSGCLNPDGDKANKTVKYAWATKQEEEDRLRDLEAEGTRSVWEAYSK